MGDEVQAIKAGILETADVFAVNKADREGADATMRDLELMIALGSEAMVAAGKRKGHVVHGGQKVDVLEKDVPAAERWTPPILKCVSTRGEGIDDLVAALARHREWLESTETGRARRRQRLAEEVRESLREALIEQATDALASELDAAVTAVESRTVDPYTAIEHLLAKFQSR